MSSKQHCDVCDKIIGASRGGHVVAEPLHGLADGNKPMDLCLEHYNSYKRIVQEWLKYEQGFAASWPKRMCS